MIRRTFLKKAVVAALSVVAGTTLVSKVTAGSQMAYKPDVLWVVDRMVYFHNQGRLKDITQVKNSRFNQAIQNEFLVSEYYSPLGFNLNCLDYRDIVNLLFEKTGIAYGIHVEVPYYDYISYLKLNIKDDENNCKISLIFRHGKLPEMTMFTGRPIYVKTI